MYRTWTEIVWSRVLSVTLVRLVFCRLFRLFLDIGTLFGRATTPEQSLSFNIGTYHFALSCSDMRRPLLLIFRARFDRGLDIVHQRKECEHRVMRVAFPLKHDVCRPFTIPRRHDKGI